MIVKTKSLIILTKNSIMTIPLVRVLWQSNKNFFIFSILKIVIIELKMTFQSFLFVVAQTTYKTLTFYISCPTYQTRVYQSFSHSYEFIQQDDIF